MTALSIPLFAFFTVVTVLILAVALRRLMGMRLSPLRTLIAALIALFLRLADHHGDGGQRRVREEPRRAAGLRTS